MKLSMGWGRARGDTTTQGLLPCHIRKFEDLGCPAKDALSAQLCRLPHSFLRHSGPQSALEGMHFC
jgi:hypothetical protein